MKGCARTLLLQLAGFLATAGVVMFFLRERHGLPAGRTIGVSLGIAFFVWMALGYLRPLRGRIVKYAVGAVVCPGLAFGIYAAYLAHAGR